MRYIFFISLLLFFAGCKVTNEQFPIEPKIAFKSFNTDSIQVGGNLIVTFTFTDGDGDIGVPASIPSDTVDGCDSPDYKIFANRGFDFFCRDIRDSCVTPSKAPYYSPAKNKESIQGEIVYTYTTDCKKVCSVPGCRDTAQFEFRLRDRAGHFSNIVVTPKCIITGCQ